MKSRFIHLGIALVITILALVSYSSFHYAVVQASASVAALEGEITARTESAGRIAQARAALAEIAGGEALVESYFVSEEGVVNFIDDIEARGRSLGSTLTVSAVETSQADEHPALLLTLQTEGSFDALMRTIGTIEHAPYALSVADLSLAQRGEHLWRGTLRIRVGSLPPATSTQSMGTAPFYAYF